MWYFDTFAKILAMEGESRLSRVGLVHKYIRRIFLNHFGSDILREKLLQKIEEWVERCLRMWSSQPCIEVKQAASAMMFDFAGKQLFSYDADEASADATNERFNRFLRGFMAFPLNFPGKLIDMLRGILKERLDSGKTSNVDFLDQAIDSMRDQEFLTEDFIVQLMFAGILASSESILIMLAMIFKLLSETPTVLAELRAGKYRSKGTPKSITRYPTERIYDPKGWSIMVVTTALHTNHNVFENPLEFNPWRWKYLDSGTISQNFTPFGGGMRQCVGAEYTRAFLCAFLHVLVTKFRWTEIKIGDVYRNPVLGFKDGVSEHKKLIDMLKGILREILNAGKASNVDFLDQAIDSMHDQEFLTEDFHSSDDVCRIYDPKRVVDHGRHYCSTRIPMCLRILLNLTLGAGRWTEIKIGNVYRNPILGFKDGVNVELSESWN
ncbi:cucurbitadienol 11-hydroxylase-like [Eucalyptus grandis]|uniref:cucurbitadienol 11-hydroxylase-like n=1 Tax=Eucalyptus grandis TaxID=71139 RepID=UPI00192EDD9E|nr:cucurbitadienol 11-hydroxylase-like [Eucalyptus grandis]